MRHPKLHRFLVSVLLGVFFEKFRWYRAWQGGHWERWYIEFTHSDHWFTPHACVFFTGHRPFGGRGRPTCEHHP